jgi:hypothetical protein
MGGRTGLLRGGAHDGLRTPRRLCAFSHGIPSRWTRGCPSGSTRAAFRSDRDLATAQGGSTTLRPRPWRRGRGGWRRAGGSRGATKREKVLRPGHRALAVRVSPHQAPFHSSLSPTKTHRRAAREALWATGVVDLSREADTMAAGGWRLGEREARREGREARRETRCEWGVGGEPLPLPFRAIGGVHAAAVADQPVARARVNFNPTADPRSPRHLERKDAARRPGSSDPALGHLRPARSLLSLLFFQPCQPHTPACASCSPPRP